MTSFIKIEGQKMGTIVPASFAVLKWIENVVEMIQFGLLKESFKISDIISNIEKLSLKERNFGFNLKMEKRVTENLLEIGRKQTIIKRLPTQQSRGRFLRENLFPKINVKFATLVIKLKLIIPTIANDCKLYGSVNIAMRNYNNAF